MITTFLFDLDGTLLPLDQDIFIQNYFAGIATHFAALGYEPKPLMKAVWAGTEAMLKNDRNRRNEEAFWEVFKTMIEGDYQKIAKEFTEYYQTEYENNQKYCGFHPAAQQIIAELKKKNYKLILATNPLFPKIATYRRMAWAGLNCEDFIHITTYENSSSCKPNLRYYQEILDQANLQPKECVMVGNDVSEDMVSEKLGLKTYLVTDCLLNPDQTDIRSFHQGSLDDLLDYAKSLPIVKA